MGDKIISVNTQGFFDDDVNSFAQAHKPLALVVTEHKQSNLRNLDRIDGYSLAAGYPAKTGQRGVGVFVRDGVDYVPRRDLDRHARCGDFEVASVEIPSKNMVLTGQYRSPSSSKTSYNAKLDSFSQSLAKEPHKRHVIAGDFNIDSRKNTVTKEVLRDNRMKFHIRSSTHEMGGCLDNFATDYSGSKTRVMKAQRDQISDHSPIEMRLPSSRRSRR